MKDPAFLFYPNDYIGGTMGMTFEEKGAYIEVLMMQFNRGHMTEHMIGQVIGQLWDQIKHKFTIDENSLYYNERLEYEQKRRQNFANSRKNNKLGNNQYNKKTGHMTKHMENRNRNENINKDESKKFKFDFSFIEIDYKEAFENWIEYKKENKHSYRTQKSLLAAYKNLKLLSDYNPETAKQIVFNSMANGWAGLFRIKEDKQAKKNETKNYIASRIVEATRNSN